MRYYMAKTSHFFCFATPYFLSYLVPHLHRFLHDDQLGFAYPDVLRMLVALCILGSRNEGNFVG